MGSSFGKVVRGMAAYLAGASLVPILAATFLVIRPCGGGSSGVVVAFHGWGISVNAAYCSKS